MHTDINKRRASGRERQRKYLAAHPERGREATRRYAQNHPERIRAKDAQADPAKVKARRVLNKAIQRARDRGRECYDASYADRLLRGSDAMWS